MKKTISKVENEKTLIKEAFEIKDTKWKGKSFVTEDLIFGSLLELEEFLKVLTKSGTG